MSDNAPNPSASHDEMLSRMAEHVATAQKENPEADLKVDSQWWVPSVNLGTDLKSTLDQDTNDKLNTSMAKMFERKFAPDAISEVRSEMKTILADHPEMLERMNASIFQNEQSLAAIHQYASSEQAAGRDVFASCSAMKK